MKTNALALACVAMLAGGAAQAGDAAPFSNLTVAVEVPYLSLNSNHGGGSASAGGNAWFDDGFDDTFNYRLIATTNLTEEFGARVRYFDYDAGIGNDGGPTTSLFFQTSLLDIETTADMKLGKWDLVVSAGARSANIEWPDEGGSPGFRFEGWGFTTALDTRRAFDNGFAIVAGIRHSQIFGDIEELGTPADTNSNNVVPMTEFKAGIEYSRAFFANSTVTFGLHYEATLISSLSGNVDNDIDPEDTDIGLMGPALSVKLAFDPSKL